MAVASGGFINGTAAMQSKERLDLADYLAAGAAGVKHLVEETKKRTSDAEDALSAVESLVGLGQQGWGQEAAEEQVEVKEVLLSQLAEAPAQGSQAGRQAGKKGVCMAQY